MTNFPEEFYDRLMILPKGLCLFFAFASHFLAATSFTEQFNEVGYVEICAQKERKESFDELYTCFDEMITFLQENPAWAHKLYNAKERFIRSPERSRYSTDFFGFYDESERNGRNQLSFYYAPHFHEFICSHYKEFAQAPILRRFLEACFTIQQSYSEICEELSTELGCETLFSSTGGHPPILFKVVKYLPSYTAQRPHYDGTAFSLFLDSTDSEALLLSPYKESFSIDDFTPPQREFSREQNSLLLIPGALLKEFSIYPTPHIVLESGKTRYAAIAFAMRPHYLPQKTTYSPLPCFGDKS